MFSPAAVIVDATREVRSKAIKPDFTGYNATTLLRYAKRSPLAAKAYPLRIERLLQTVPLLQPNLRSVKAVCIWERDVTTRLRFNFAYQAHSAVFGDTIDSKQKMISELKDDVAFFKKRIVGPLQPSNDLERLARIFVESVVVEEITASFYCGGPSSIIQELSTETGPFETAHLPEEMHFLFDSFYEKSRGRLKRQVLTALIDEETETSVDFLEAMSKPKAFRARFNLGPSAGSTKTQAKVLRDLAPQFALHQATRAEKNWQHELRNLGHHFPTEMVSTEGVIKLEAVEAKVFEAALGLEEEVQELKAALEQALANKTEQTLSLT